MSDMHPHLRRFPDNDQKNRCLFAGRKESRTGPESRGDKPERGVGTTDGRIDADINPLSEPITFLFRILK